MKKLKIGVSYEGKRDKEPIKILVEKIFTEIGIPIRITKMLSENTGILGFVGAHTRNFFMSSDPVDLAIYLTDKDKSKKDRKKIIVKKITDIDPLLLEKTMIGIPSPHFEKWLITDQSAVKKVCGLPGSKALPKNKSSKLLIESLQEKMNPRITIFDLYNQLAEEAKISQLRKNTEFDLFYIAVLEVLKINKFL